MTHVAALVAGLLLVLALFLPASAGATDGGGTTGPAGRCAVGSR